MESGDAYDAIVVGLGPVGAVMTGLLAAQGFHVLAIEKDNDIYPLPRAAGFDHEAMRVFQQLGVAEDILPHTQSTDFYDFVGMNGDLLMRFDRRGKVSPSGWRQVYCFHQPKAEEALRRRLAQAEKVDVCLSTRLKSFEVEDDKVRAVIVDQHGEKTVEARYLIGCDGASSTVRQQSGIQLSDYGFDEPWLVIDAIPGPGATLPDRNLQICDPERPTTIIMLSAGRHRWEFMIKPGETAEQMLQPDTIAALLAPWGSSEQLNVERKAVYRFHGLVAEQWRKGPVFLVGDAAHQTPPFAGQGMCSGIRDAANLAWKLAAVSRGQAHAAILDTYQSEREPHIRAVIEGAIAMGRVVCTLDKDAAAERDRTMVADREAGRPGLAFALPTLRDGVFLELTPAAGSLFPQPWAQVGSDTIKLDDVLGAAPALICLQAPEPIGEQPGPVRVFALDGALMAPFEAALGRWLKDHGAESVLVRPDRYVFGTGSAALLMERFNALLTKELTS